MIADRLDSQALAPPAGSVAVARLDLVGRRHRLLVNVVALALLLPATAFVFRVAAWIDDRRPGLFGGATGAGVIVIAVTAFLLLVIAHEALHAACFAWFGARPRIVLRHGMLFVSAGESLLRRDEYLVVLVAPLLVLSLAGVGALVWGPPVLAPVFTALLIVNAVGSAGDLVTAALLLPLPRRALLQQTAVGLSVYLPRAE